MGWGFECGDGWYQLLYDLSQKLVNYQAEHSELNIEAEQVKSKFGTLRFHLDGGDGATQEMIDRACLRASGTCEITGKPGELCASPSHRFSSIVLCPEKAEELGFALVNNKDKED